MYGQGQHDNGQQQQLAITNGQTAYATHEWQGGILDPSQSQQQNYAPSMATTYNVNRASSNTSYKGVIGAGKGAGQYDSGNGKGNTGFYVFDCVYDENDESTFTFNKAAFEQQQLQNGNVNEKNAFGRRMAIVDCGAPYVVVGLEEIRETDYNGGKVPIDQSETRKLKFGDVNIIRYALGFVDVPFLVNFRLRAFVIPGNIKMLMSLEALTNTEAIINFKTFATIICSRRIMLKAAFGHLFINLDDEGEAADRGVKDMQHVMGSSSA